ncbi:MAG: hypothetical protein K2Q22_07240, partial [Cytophagales bacterium]|nr:hypothetical protein [Cytophagales bacterium]
MKKLIFLCLLLLSFASGYSHAGLYDPVSATSQILEFTDLAPTTPFYSCGTAKSIKLTIKPQVTNLTGTIKINIADASNGLFINDGSVSNSSKVTIDNVSSTPKQLVLNLSNVSENVEITIPLYAAYCNLFTESELSKSITNVFSASMDPGTALPIGVNTSLTVYKNAPLLLLDPINTAPTTIRTASADPSNNNLVTFQFALLNNYPDKSFDGWVSFQEDATKLGSSFDIRAIKFFLYNPVTGQESLIKTVNNPVVNLAGSPNNNDFITTATSLNVSVPAGQKLLIREEVRVNGCLEGVGGNSTPILQLGCGDYNKLKSYENCGIPIKYDTQITGSVASFQFVTEKSDYFHNTMCANNYRETKYITYKNNGTGIAYNTKLVLNNEQWETFIVEKDPTKIFIEINGVRYTPNLNNYDLPYRDSNGDVIYYTSASQLPTDVYLPDEWLNNVNNSRRAYDHSYRYFEYDINADMKWKDLSELFGLSPSKWYDPLYWGHYNLSCASSDPAVLGEKQ